MTRNFFPGESIHFVDGGHYVMMTDEEKAEFESKRKKLTENLPKLVGCPFCGAECDFEIDGYDEETYQVSITAEHTEKCPFIKSMGSLDSLEFDFKDSADLLEIFNAWNRRK